MIWTDGLAMTDAENRQAAVRRFRDRWIFPLFLLLEFSYGLGQDTQVVLRGRVLDSATGRPLPNVNVEILGTDRGTVSDRWGRFTLILREASPITIQVSHIGYETAHTFWTPDQPPVVQFRLKETFLLMDEVVATGTRTPRIHRNVPVPTEVISTQDIREAGTLNVADLLNQQAGVQIASAVDGGSVINLLGMDSKYILILRDGKPITGKFNGRVDLDQIPTSSLQKIEILKGPSSALYGSEAMGGVINLVTDTTRSSSHWQVAARYQNPARGSVQPWQWNRGTHALRLSWGGRRSRLAFRLDGDFQKIGLDKEVLYLDIDQVRKGTFHTWLRGKITSGISVEWDQSWFQDRETGHSLVMNNSTTVTRWEEVVRGQWTPHSAWTIEPSIRFGSYGRTYSQIRPWGSTVTADTTAESTLELELLIRRETSVSTLNLGADWTRSAYRSDRVDSARQWETIPSLFWQQEYRRGRLSWIAGGRWDREQNGIWQFSPRIGVMVTPGERWKVRATIGGGYRRPSFLDRFISWNHIQFGYRVVGNPRLVSEQSLGLTLGAEWYRDSRFRFSLLGYVTRFRHMIKDYVIEPGLLSYHNIDRVRFLGLELQGRWSLSSRLLLSGGLNWLDNRNELTGQQVPNTQPLSLNARLSYRLHTYHLEGAVLCKWVASYTPQEYDPVLGTFVYADHPRRSYTIWEGHLVYHSGEKVEWVFGVQNATDYINLQYGPFTGRRMYAEIRWNRKGIK
ncbi:MAG: TonB-dependent receptor [Candidatus Neomarinimicrobiota bacterium]|nr:MAG: TonB-dependent receptor [Candidatus Neomarinimicrobiota bacterium]